MKIKDMNDLKIFHKYLRSGYVPITIIDENDDIAEMFDFYYEKVHSGEKTILDIVTDNVGQFLQIISIKYVAKWNRLTDLLLHNNYDILSNYSISEIITGSKASETDNQSHRITTSDGTSKQSNKTITTNTVTDNDATYGFNSEFPVDTNKVTSLGEETYIGNADDNVTLDTASGDTTNEAHGNYNHEYSDNRTKKGYFNFTPQELLEREIVLRNTYNILDIMCEDLDKLICLSIYE